MDVPSQVASIIIRVLINEELNLHKSIGCILHIGLYKVGMFSKQAVFKDLSHNKGKFFIFKEPLKLALAVLNQQL